MKFKAFLTENGVNLLEKRFLPAFEKMGKTCYLFLTKEHVFFLHNLLNGDGVQCIVQFRKDVLFDEYRISSQNEDRIAFSLDVSLLVKYELALQKKHKEETLSDVESLVELKTKCSYEIQLSRIYTREMFKKFQVEVEEMYSCFSTTQLHVDGPFVIFLVKERVQSELNRREIRDFEVLYNRSVGEVRCICSCFNFYGYLCRHALCVLNFNGVEEIPLRYILPRWRKDYKRIHRVDNGVVGFVDGADRVQWFDQLCKIGLQVVEGGVVSLDHYKVAMEVLEQGLDRVFSVEEKQE